MKTHTGGHQQVDHEARIRHFQAINAGNVTNMVNINLALSTGALGFAVNMLVGTSHPLPRGAALWTLASLVLLFLAVGVGVGVLFTRMEDVRSTIQAVILVRDNPELVTDQNLIAKAVEVKRRADSLNRATNVLIYAQGSLFLVGALCLIAAAFIVHRSVLLP